MTLRACLVGCATAGQALSMQGQLDWMAAQVLGPGWASAFVPPEPGPEGMRKSTVSAQPSPCLVANF